MGKKPPIAIGVVLAACASGCGREDASEQAQPGTDEASAALGLTSWADAIAQARCDREQRCESFRTARDFSSRDACLSEIRREWRKELNAFDCPGGVHEEALHECLDEIRNEDCGQPLDTLGRIVACRPADICKAKAP